MLRDNRFVLHGIDIGAGSVAFLPDGRSIAVATRPNHTTGLQPVELPEVDVAIVVDLETGKPKFTLKGKADFEVAVWVSAGGKELATFAHGVARYYDPADGKELRAVPVKGSEYGRPWIAPGADRIAIQSVIAGADLETLFDSRTGRALLDRGRQVVQAAMTAAGRTLLERATGKVTA